MKVWVFFYGSYMNLDVLAEVDYRPDTVEVARLAGWDIRIAPRANLVPSATHSVHGVLTTATHAELARLYAHAEDVLGEVYLPRAVLVETRDGAPGAGADLRLSRHGAAAGRSGLRRAHRRPGPPPRLPRGVHRAPHRERRAPVKIGIVVRA
jgi:hypothetical protein